MIFYLKLIIQYKITLIARLSNIRAFYKQMILLITNRILTNKRIVKSSISLFSTRNKRIEEVGFKTEDIINTKKLTYIPDQKLEFVNGKCLVYQSKKGILTTLRRFIGYYTSISTFTYLIYTNPLSGIFPASYPIFWVFLILCNLFVILVTKFMFKRYQWNQQIIHKVYLNESGSTTQIHYADQWRRNLFGQPLNRTYYNSIFTNPTVREKQEIMPNNSQFPQKITDFQTSSFGSTWCKYYSNGQNYVLIPKSYQYLRKDVLIQILEGKTVKNT